MSEPKLYVYRLDVTLPPGSDEPGWRPAGWQHRSDWPDYQQRFAWPERRHYLSLGGANGQARVFRSYGAKVKIVRSNPVTWPGGDGDG
jgi:hypothetical protein